METLWTEERTNRLETLYRRGWSFSLMAAELNVSRNAAVGKIHRMNLPKRVVTVSLPHPLHKRRRFAATMSERPALSPDDRYRCSITELGNSSCRYPTWQANAAPHERLYCGCPDASVANGVSYCRQHALLCASARR